VNAPLVSLQCKNTNNTKSEVRFKQLIRDAITIDSSTPILRINLNEHPIIRAVPKVPPFLEGAPSRSVMEYWKIFKKPTSLIFEEMGL
jgi:hypothetical protein